MWLDDLFPKAKFLDALVMVEKAGHKKRVMAARTDFINEGRPKTSVEEDDDFGLDASGATETGEKAQSAPAARPQTPSRDDVPDDEDLYGATPRNARTQQKVPDDEDDLDALIAEAEGEDSSRQKQQPPADDADDLDALIAEAETTDEVKVSAKKPGNTNGTNDDFADEEAAMQEMDDLW